MRWVCHFGMSVELKINLNKPVARAVEFSTEPRSKK